MLYLQRSVKQAQSATLFIICLCIAALPGYTLAQSADTQATTAPTPITPSAQSADAMRAETRYVVYCLEQIHYAHAPIASINMGEFIEEYIGKFDPHHLFLLQPEVDSLKGRFAGPMPFYLRQGNLFPAFEIFNIYQDRANKRLDWIMKRLDEPFDFTSKETFVPDRRKLSWPQTTAQADILWDNRLKYELLTEMLSDEELTPPHTPTPMACWKMLEKFLNALQNPLHEQPFLYDSFVCPDFYDAPQKAADDFRYVFKHPSDQTPAEKLAVADAENEHEALKDLTEARKTIKERYERYQKSIRELEPSEIEELFLTTLTQMYDPHSTFFSADTMDDFSIAIRNSLVGIGAVLTDEDGMCTVREL
ncbi:MAG TPA: hypothetical protein PLV25_06465, partial [Opitutales bacterium]|nr:hypothetical protein [Opitutales bacterium]